MQLTASTPWVISVQDSGTSATGMALRDVSRDWRSVFACNPLRISSGESPEFSVAIGAEACRTAAGSLRELHEEQFVLELVTVQAEGSTKQVLCAYGGGIRGEIYAIYELSKRVLGVDPFWFWTDNMPKRQSSIKLTDDFCFVSEPPRFRFRGWFMNDEDLLTGWAPDSFQKNGIDSQTWDRIFETILRANGNMVVPGTFIFPNEPQLLLASSRGLVIGQHHVEVLGLNVFRWPNEQVYSYTSDPMILEKAWEDCVIAAEDREVLWSVGYRGRHDHPFWVDDPSAAPSYEERGAIISKAVAKQVEILRRHRPHDPVLMNLWMEGVELWQAGHIKVPDGVMIVWPDDGHGLVLDEGRASFGHGIYYHTAMYDGIGSQLSEAVPVETIASEMERMAQVNAVGHVLVNVSDIRPCVLTTSAIMELAWGEIGDPSDYYRRWCEAQFGTQSALAVSSLYRKYFESPWRYNQDLPDRLEDNAYHTYAREFLIRTARMNWDEDFNFGKSLLHVPQSFRRLGNPSTLEFARFMMAGTQSVQSKWSSLMDECESLFSSLPEDRQNFFRGHLITQVAIHQHSNAMLHSVSKALIQLAENDEVAAVASLKTAAEQVRSLLLRLRDAEYGRWVNWYGGEMFVGITQTLEFIGTVQKFIEANSLPIRDDQAHLLKPFRAQYAALKSYQVTD